MPVRPISLLAIASTITLLASPAIAAPKRPGTMVETIAYETGPCFGTCPVYAVSLSSNGRGIFEGRNFTQVKGVRRFTVDRKTLAEFRRRLDAVRPVGEVLKTSQDQCRLMATDMTTIDVRWTGGHRPAHLAYNLGCDRETLGWMRNVLQKAVTVLPIQAFIGERPLRPSR